MTRLLGLLGTLSLGAAAQSLVYQSQLTANGGRVGWSQANNTIAYDNQAANGYFKLYVIQPDGTGNACLTCSGSPGVGVLETVSVVSGTDISLPNSGTWTATAGGGTGASGTFTASGGNLATVTITNGGSGYTSNPTFVPNSGSLGTSTVTFPTLSGLNAGNPTWTPDGRYILFMAQNGPSLGSATLDFAGFPGQGANNDLWATDANGHFWKLTNVGGVNGVGNGGVICPTMSWNGTQLAWGQRVSPNPSYEFGTWEIAVASFSETGGPSIGTATTYAPGANQYYYEPHSFSLDNSTLFFMGNLDNGMATSPPAMDIYSFNLNTQVLTNLTNSLTDWAEYPEAMPNTNKIVYMSMQDNTRVQGYCKSDLWVMNYDGTDKQRLTFYNDPGSPEYVSSGICLDDHRSNAGANQMVVFNNQFAANNHTGAPGTIWRFSATAAATPAVIPRLTSGVQIPSFKADSPFPCQTASACTANSGAEILFQSSQQNANGCEEIYSMHTDGSNVVNLTKLIYTNGFGSGPTKNQGSPTYSPDGKWVMFYMQDSGSAYGCTQHAVFSGAATDGDVGICNAQTYSGHAPYTDCAVVLAVTPGTGTGYLHAEWSQDGTKIFYGLWLGVASNQEGNSGKLQWAAFTPGTPPSASAFAAVDPQGDGTGHTNWYEPWDSDGWNGGVTCKLYYTTNSVEDSQSYNNVALAYYNICNGTTGIVSTPYDPGNSSCYSEFIAFPTAHPDVALSVSGCPYLNAQWNNPADSVLDLVMFDGNTGAGMAPLTGYNLAGRPEYAYPALVSSPRWSYDGTYVVFSVTSNATLEGQLSGYPGSTGTYIWKFNINLVPAQTVGQSSLSGHGEYK